MSRTLGHYTITGEIGRGGMAVVYSAIQESLNRIVALKELDLSRFRSEPNSLERFRLEARSAASLDHPNIITIYDLWEDGNKVYIAMEHIDGVELKDVLLRHGAMEFVYAIHIAVEVCSALYYAHGRGMVHRDVKPGNIMLSRKGDVRLMDFGIVSVSGSGDLTVTGQILGTPAYMAPEQISGENLGPGADVFGLGVVLYELLTGRRPFSGDNQLALIQQIMNKQPVPPGHIVPELPRDLSDTVLRCLEKRPENRFPDMDSLAVELVKSLPAQAPSRISCITKLVSQTLSGAGLDTPGQDTGSERTSILRPEHGLKAENNTESTVGSLDAVVESDRDVNRDYHSPYSFETDPPADLPPLDPSGSGAGEVEESATIVEEEEIPLSLKELPPDEPEDLSRPERRLKWRYLLWGLIPVFVITGFILWKFTGIPISVGRSIQGFLSEKANPVPGPALLMVYAETEANILLDGEPLGDVKDSRMFEIKPGLHRVEAVSAQFGSKSFIIEIEPGQMKELSVRWEGE